MAEEKVNLPQLNMKIFMEGGNPSDFAHFGWGDASDSFYGYRIGYKLAADTLVDKAINTSDISFIDTVVFPILFLYRQFLELTMKSLYLSFTDDSERIQEANIKKCNHDLMKIWEILKSLLIEETDVEDELLRSTEAYICQYHEFDKKSFKYRYPVDKKLESVLEKEYRINLPHLRDRIDELESFFEAAYMILSNIKENITSNINNCYN